MITDRDFYADLELWTTTHSHRLNTWRVFEVKDANPKIVADDWQCNDPRPVNDIHIWGSWKTDLQPTGQDPSFSLTIWSDQPEDSATGAYSRPKLPLVGWNFAPGEYTKRLWKIVDPGEYWYNPNTGELVENGDEEIWQYNFILPEPWEQQVGTIYWLSVQAINVLTGYEFGWKTSQDSFNDDAVWDDVVGTGTQWNELRYPSGHPDAGDSVDMAFVITVVPEPATRALLGLGTLALTAIRRRRR